MGTALAAVLLRPGEGQPTALGQLGGEPPDARPVLILEIGVGIDAGPVGAKLRCEEVADLLPERLLLGC